MCAEGKKLLGGLTAQETADVIVRSMGRAALPHLREAKARERAIVIARRQGVLERLAKDAAADKPITVLPYGGFREFSRTGNRSNFEKLLWERWAQIDSATLGCYLGLDRVARLQDLLWADCETTWWIVPAHEGYPPGKPRVIDLWVAMKATQLATALCVCEGRIAAEVRERVVAEVRRRAIEPFFRADSGLTWKTLRMNWNAVCHGGVNIAALLVEDDPQRLARLIVETLENLPAFLDGFADDGGCSEGPGYWSYGFGWYVDLACALYDFTGGKIDIMAGAKIERICRYPLAVFIRPGHILPFADSGSHGYLSANLAIRVNRFHRVPELFGLCRLTEDGSLAVGSLADLSLYDGAKHRPLEEQPDSFLPDLGVARLRCGSVTVGAKAGHNGEHHNHNDVGSFIVHKGATFFLTDPGAPVYSANTFNERRYESIFCNSFGHGVPVVNGQLQSAGREHAGTMRAEGLNTSGARTIRIEMAKAYAVPSLRALERVIEAAPGGGRVSLADRFVFAGRPESVEEAFITTLPAEAAPDGRSVVVNSPADGALRLRIDGAAGAFAVADLTEESKESRAGDLLRRITFRPETLEPEMTLRFVMEFD